MTVCSVYIGDLEDPGFQWEGGDWNGNTPRKIGPDFPPDALSYNGSYHRWVQNSMVEGKQTDYGGWVARVTRTQIEDYLRICYAGHEEKPWVRTELPKVHAFVAGLKERALYGLVAVEW